MRVCDHRRGHVLLTATTCLLVIYMVFRVTRPEGLSTQLYPLTSPLQVTPDVKLSKLTHNPVVQVLQTPFKIDRNRTDKSLPPMVLVTAYQHSGSSIVASLLAKDDKTLYFYEPVHAMYKATFGFKKWIQHVNLNLHSDGSIRNLCPREQEMVESSILKISECNFKSLDHEVCKLIKMHNMNSIKKRCTVKSCAEYHKFSLEVLQSLCSSQKRQNATCDMGKYVPSMGKYAEDCKDIHFFTLKLLRYEMRHTLKILQNTPQMFMIHLIRDPRGIINSFIKRKHVRPESSLRESFMEKGLSKIDAGVKILAMQMCNLMRHNLHMIETHPNLRNRIKIVHYEDFAGQPVEFTERLYRLFSLDVPPSVQAWLEKTTGAEEKRGKYVRQNSTETAQLWQNQLLPEHLKIIDAECSSLYRHFTK